MISVVKMVQVNNSILMTVLFEAKRVVCVYNNLEDRLSNIFICKDEKIVEPSQEFKADLAFAFVQQKVKSLIPIRL